MVNKIPQTLDEALVYLQENHYTVMAGGTDLMVQKHSWLSSKRAFEEPLLFIKYLDELRYIKKEDDWIKIGALSTLTDLLESEMIPSVYHDALFEMASVGIRNEATIAGNIENASPAGDSLPVLYCLDAIVVLKSVDGLREIAIADYIIGVRKTARKQSELIVEIKFPVVTYTHALWKKVGGRKADAISKLSFVGLANIVDGTVLDLRLSFGAVAPVVIRDMHIEKRFQNVSVTALKEQIDEIKEAYNGLIKPIDDQRSNKAYRRHVSLNILEEFIGRL